MTFHFSVTLTLKIWYGARVNLHKYSADPDIILVNQSINKYLIISKGFIVPGKVSIAWWVTRFIICMSYYAQHLSAIIWMIIVSPLGKIILWWSTEIALIRLCVLVNLSILGNHLRLNRLIIITKIKWRQLWLINKSSSED